MERFNTLQEAVKSARTRCSSWHFATDKHDVYGRANLLAIAEVHDSENPIDEDSFYVVSPQCAIGLCEDGEDIEWLFLPNSSPAEELPTTYQSASASRACPHCGAGVMPESSFCGDCGKKLG